MQDKEWKPVEEIFLPGNPNWIGENSQIDGSTTIFLKHSGVPLNTPLCTFKVTWYTELRNPRVRDGLGDAMQGLTLESTDSIPLGTNVISF